MVAQILYPPHAPYLPALLRKHCSRYSCCRTQRNPSSDTPPDLDSGPVSPEHASPHRSGRSDPVALGALPLLEPCRRRAVLFYLANSIILTTDQEQGSKSLPRHLRVRVSFSPAYLGTGARPRQIHRIFSDTVRRVGRGWLARTRLPRSESVAHRTYWPLRCSPRRRRLPDFR